MKNALFTTLALALSGLASAQNYTAADIVNKVDAAQKAAKDLSFKISGAASFEGGNQKVDLDVQAITAGSLARIVFNAPDTLADNVVVADSKEVRNYLYLTNQITVTPLRKAASTAGAGNLDFSALTNPAALLRQYTVRLVGSTGAAGSRVFQLDGTPKDQGLGSGKATVYVTEQGWRPTRIVLLSDAGKTVADLNISNFKTNSGLSAARLKTLPKNAEIIRN